MNEYEVEPIRGLPGLLPKGETILWQGAPDWRSLALAAFHVRGVAFYFGLLALVGLIGGSTIGALLTLAAGGVCIALFAGLAWLTARTTVYTLTDRRIVLRIGIALPKCLNLPLALVRSADLRELGRGHADIALTMAADGEGQRLGWLLLWPHARPWQLRDPRPMLRALPDAEAVAAILVRACHARIERTAPPATPVMLEAAA